MHGWTEVVTYPLGLAGLALWLVYRYLTRRKSSPKWLISACLAMAIFTIVGALVLSYIQITTQRPAQSPDPKFGQTIGKVEQETDGGPAVSGVQGDVTIQQGEIPADSQQESPPDTSP
jgi:predicted PurR-regulated permease PerM